MVAGYWVNQDGLLLQYGQQKAYPELGGDYLAYAETRLAEVYVPLASTTWGQTSGVPVSFPGIANTFSSGTTSPFGNSSAGLLSLTLQFPMQTIAFNTSATFNSSNIWVDRVEYEQLVTAVTGSTGTATGLQGIGLVVWNYQTNTAYVQVTPGGATAFLGAGFTNATMANSNKWTFWPVGFSTAMSVFPGTAVTGGTWGGNIPLITNAITAANLVNPSNPTGVPQWAYIGAWATGGTAGASSPYAGTSAAGLGRLRIFYNIYGNIQV
jgi:hypothetical protein